MIFDKTHKVIIETMSNAESIAFVKFLQSECLRHQRDIDEAEELIKVIRDVFDHNRSSC